MPGRVLHTGSDGDVPDRAHGSSDPEDNRIQRHAAKSSITGEASRVGTLGTHPVTLHQPVPVERHRRFDR